jgi:hypothetical protein
MGTLQESFKNWKKVEEVPAHETAEALREIYREKLVEGIEITFPQLIRKCQELERKLALAIEEVERLREKLREARGDRVSPR